MADATFLLLAYPALQHLAWSAVRFFSLVRCPFLLWYPCGRHEVREHLVRDALGLDIGHETFARG